MAKSNKTAFTWNEENYAIVLEAYQAKVEADGAEAAAESEFLKSLAEKVGALSDRSVRSKLTTSGDYVKPAMTKSVAKTNQIRKEHYIRALANTLGLDEDTLDSLKNAKVDALSGLTMGFGITDVAAASARDYEIEPQQVAQNYLAYNGE